jgi:hypothetical protein
MLPGGSSRWYPTSRLDRCWGPPVMFVGLQKPHGIHKNPSEICLKKNMNTRVTRVQNDHKPEWNMLNITIHRVYHFPGPEMSWRGAEKSRSHWWANLRPGTQTQKLHLPIHLSTYLSTYLAMCVYLYIDIDIYIYMGTPIGFDNN